MVFKKSKQVFHIQSFSTLSRKMLINYQLSVTFPEVSVIYLPLWLLYLQNKMNYSLVGLLFHLVRMVPQENTFFTFLVHIFGVYIIVHGLTKWDIFCLEK
jgi:hypothetical protein